MQRMRRVTTRKTKEIEKESINILFDATYSIRKFFHSLVKTCKNSCKHLLMGRILCSDEFFIKRLISKKTTKQKQKQKKNKKKERKVLFPLLVRFTF